MFFIVPNLKIILSFPVASFSMRNEFVQLLRLSLVIAQAVCTGLATTILSKNAASSIPASAAIET